MYFLRRSVKPRGFYNFGRKTVKEEEEEQQQQI
jgi:hypothetical protein